MNIQNKIEMSPKKRYLYVYLDPRLEEILEQCLEDPEVKKQLIVHKFKDKASGVAKLAVYRFLEDKGKLPSVGKHSRKKDGE